MAAGAEPRAVVTGGSGFIGAWIVGRLVAEGFRVLVVDRQAGRPEGRKNPPAVRDASTDDPRVEAVSADITAPEAAGAVVAFRPRLVVHAAAQTNVSRSVADPVEDARVNVGGTLAMLEAAREAGAGGFVFFSSAAVYGEPRRLPVRESHPTRPLSPYGLSKLAASAYVDYYRTAGRLPAVTLIPANAYGPGQEVGTDGAAVAAFMRAAAGREALTLAGDGGQTRDFVYVEDIVQAVWLAWRWLESGEAARGEAAATAAGVSAGPGGLRGPSAPTGWPLAAPGRGLGLLAGGRFNIGAGVETRIADLAGMVEQVAGRRLERIPVPPRAGDIRRSSLDPSLARAAFGWAAKVGLSEGLRRTYAWWQERVRG